MKALLLGVVLLLVSACTSQPSSPVAAPSSAVTTRPAPAVPKIRWSGCGDRFQCAQVSVPLDYRAPAGKHITLSVIRLPATGKSRGPLVVNFGGPGTTGVSQLQRIGPQYPASLRAHFDLVSFDPRGTGASTPLRCKAIAPSGTVGTDKFWASVAAVGQRCHDSLLEHSSSATTARDIDLLRAAMGAEQISYLGYSYGTFLGAVYAKLFPTRLRAMTLDGTLDLDANTAAGDVPVDVRADVASAQSAQTAQFLAACARVGKKCAFSGGDVRAKFSQVVAAARADGSFPGFVESLSNYLEQGAPTWRYLAEWLNSLPRGSRTTKSPQPAVLDHSPGFLAVQCADSSVPQDRAVYARLAEQEDRRNPIFGASAVYDMAQCVGWGHTDTDRYTGPWGISLPVLIINNRYDPATPLGNAEATARELGNGRVLVVEGAGHTSLNVPSRCAAGVMAGYFLAPGEKGSGEGCRADYVPFS